MFEEKVEAIMNRHSFSLKNKKIVVGVSGGPDSLSLLHYLWKESETRNLSLVAAHVDHMFRGEESFADAMFVKGFCAEKDIVFEMTRVNVPKLMTETGKSSQVAAREARFTFYQEIMERYRFPFLALGHHGDDQIETMLMRMTRGSTGNARAGIPFLRPFHKGSIIRPFLSMTKDEIEEYCIKYNLHPRRDPSNEKKIYSRNRFRLEVLPFLKSENRQVHEQFQRFSEDLYSDESFLHELTAQRLNIVLTKRIKGQISMDISAFLAMPMPLQRRGIQLILNYLYDERPTSLSAIHIDQVYSLIRSPNPSGKLSFPNRLQVVRSYGQCHFHFEENAHQEYRMELKEPCTVRLPNGGSITLEYIDHFLPGRNEHHAFFDLNSLEFPLIIRTRNVGDKMSLKGMSGSKKIKDIFIDKKIPLQERDGWPVVTDGKGEILWLPDLKKSACEGFHQSAESYILLTYKSENLLGGTRNDER
ncbi:MAG: tRNA lysidine(34) synthetase TilS [Bacillota bacterium]|nr:tRNA lysidine(34) synthetase TilS [Bacillota bacterium]